MIGMQYKIILPKDYDMGMIKKRVKDNGHKTDGFPGLNFKAYLITEEGKDGNLYNSYAPLYLWNDSQGMNQFIFQGYYDNILASFGWQQINIGVPFTINLGGNFNQSRYVVEYAGTIGESKTLINHHFRSFHQYVKNAEKSLGDVLFYNPDKWGYSEFSFYQELPQLKPSEHLTVYKILHVSQS